MVHVMLEILDVFSSVWVPMYRHSKSAYLQVTLNFEWIGVVDHPTQILLTMLLSIDHSSKCHWKFA